AGRLSATSDAEAAVAASDISLLCVGTPSLPSGDIDLTHIVEVAHEIGHAIRDKARVHTIVVRSTVWPGTLRDIVLPAIEQASGKKVGRDFRVGSNPEFLREGTAVSDFHHPSKILIGANDDETAQAIESLYATLDAPCIRTSIELAEMAKYS